MIHVISKQEQQHKKILHDFTFDQHKIKLYKKKKISRVTSMGSDEGVKIPHLHNEVVSEIGVLIYPEFMEYCYFLDGCARKLLYYVIFHHMQTTCEFVFNDQVIEEFACYDAIMIRGNKSHTHGVIRSAIRKLVDHNIVTNIKREKYMVNPMIAGGTSALDRRRLIGVYANILVAKGKDGITDFFPRYNVF